MIDTVATNRTIHLHGLYVKEPDKLPDDLPRKPDGEDVHSQTPGMKFFAISMDIDANSPTQSAVSNALTMHGIPPWDVVEYQTTYIERRRDLEIDSDTFIIPPSER